MKMNELCELHTFMVQLYNTGKLILINGNSSVFNSENQ
jgi:hypothetical protein